MREDVISEQEVSAVTVKTPEWAANIEYTEGRGLVN
jgi:hypothetical protein